MRRVSHFVAIDLDEPLRNAVSSLVDSVRVTWPAKWLPREKLHVTVVFLGNLTPERIAVTQARLDELVAQQAGFDLDIEGAGTFSTQRANSVLWLGVQGDLEALHALQRRANTMLEGEARPYVPHLTLARGEELAPLAETWRTHRFGQFHVDHLTFYESTHAQYRRLSMHGFR